MMALRSYNGNLLFSSPGVAAGSESCCCQAEPDPDRVVKCCYGGICSEVTAAECAFLGGYEVNDCADCPETPAGPGGASCTTCCTKPTLDAIVTANTNDSSCGAALGSGAGATLFTGRFGEGFKATARVTLQRSPSNGCIYSFGGCFPLGTFGNFTSFGVQVTFFRKGGNGSCALIFNSVSMQFQACFAPDNPRPFDPLCTQPANGGTCQWFFGYDPLNVQSGNADDECAVAAFTGLRLTEIFWPGNTGNQRTFLAGGIPRQRDVGANVFCSAINSTDLNEPSFVFAGSASIRILG